MSRSLPQFRAYFYLRISIKLICGNGEVKRHYAPKGLKTYIMLHSEGVYSPLLSVVHVLEYESHIIPARNETKCNIMQKRVLYCGPTL